MPEQDSYEQLDKLYSTINTMMHKEQWKEIDQMLNDVDIETTDTVILLGYLTITLSASNNLQLRNKFYSDVHAKFTRDFSEEKTEDLLSGLKNTFDPSEFWNDLLSQYLN